MTTSELNKERLQTIASWRSKYSAGHNVVLPAEEAEELARLALSFLEREPVAWLCGEAVLFNPDTVAAYQKRAGVTVTPLYRHAQPAPVVLDERAEFNAWNNDENLPIAGVGAKNAAWLAWQARAAMVNSPVIPEGYVLVPRDPTDEMIAAAMDCNDVLFNSDETFCVQFGNIYDAMIAAAPQEVKGE